MLRRFLKRIARPAHEAVAALPGVRRQEDVLGLAQASRGRVVKRGNGTLALTADALRFYPWWPSDELVIPLSSVMVVDTTRRHLGKSVGATLLRVQWRAGGIDDSMAWKVGDLSGWLADLSR